MSGDRTGSDLHLLWLSAMVGVEELALELKRQGLVRSDIEAVAQANRIRSSLLALNVPPGPAGSRASDPEAVTGERILRRVLREVGSLGRLPGVEELAEMLAAGLNEDPYTMREIDRSPEDVMAEAAGLREALVQALEDEPGEEPDDDEEGDDDR